MSVWLDGRFVAATDVPRARRGAFSPFETMAARGGELPLWERHLARLEATTRRLGLPFAPQPRWRGVAAELLLQNGHADDVLRLSLLAADDGVHVLLETRARGPSGTVTLVPTVVAREPGTPPADVKAWPRTFYDAVRQQAQDAGADDGLVIAADGAVLETALANLWVLRDGVWRTPPLDGRVLPGIARSLLLEGAPAAGIAVAEERCSLGDLHRAQALAVSNAVHGPRPACLVAGPPAEAARAAADLGPVWRAATGG